MNDDEVLIQVDEDDNEIGTFTRAKAHDGSGLIHREVGVLIVDDQDRVLMQQRAAEKRHPHLWIISAVGHVPAGMSSEDAMHKELQEELGFDTDIAYIEKIFYESSDACCWAHLYVAKYDGQTITADEKEVAQFRFFSQDEWEELAQTGAKIDSASSKIAQKFWEGEYDHALARL